MYLTGNRSNFPNQIDTIVEMFNIPLRYKPDIREYQELILKDNLSARERQRLNDLTDMLEPYIFNVEKWNKFGDILINMQKFFKEGVEPYVQKQMDKVESHADDKVKYFDNETDNKVSYLNSEVSKFNNMISTKQKEVKDYTDSKVSYLNSEVDKFNNMVSNKQKEVKDYTDKQVAHFDTEVDKLNHKGLWSPVKVYQKRNIVTYGGQSYIALEDNLNNNPTENSDIWQLIAEKGEKGDPSLNINYKGEYDNALDYRLGDAVVYNGLWYYAKKNTRGNLPTNKEYWELSSHSVVVSEDKPFDNRVALWVKI